MKVLFIGDIVGKPGRSAVHALLPGIVGQYGVDIVIANCENAAGGFGVTKKIVDELYQDEIDILTSGNHIWDKKETRNFIDDYETLLRPANYPEGTAGKGSVVIDTRLGNALGVLNLEGRVFMNPLDCPFRVAEREINIMKDKTDIIIVDMHAEATSEKEALGWFLDGKVSTVLGTHTHVQTADERVLPGGTSYITDIGMTGPMDSILGIKKEEALERFLTLLPNRFGVAKGDIRLQGVLIDIDDKTGKSLSIERLNIGMEG
ncbi:MAG: TIGR00282 family metallophosphoesterase [Thermodesulfobacteriota bacterium]|nr:TIGR00282 family metallophosphoesterase [Thermodesulfobacteriota bacterium]